MLRLPPISTLFPYTTLFRSCCAQSRHHRAVFRASAPHHSATAAVPARSQKTARAFQRRVHPKIESLDHLNLLIGGSAVAVNHGELFCQSKQALGVANKHVSVGIQTAPELIDEPLLFGFVEIH